MPVNGDRVDVRREPLVVRDGCAPDRIPAGRWPSDDPLVRSEQFAVNEAIACLAPDARRGPGDSGPATAVPVTAAPVTAAACSACTRRLAPAWPRCSATWSRPSSPSGRAASPSLPDPAAAFGSRASGRARGRRAVRGADRVRDRALRARETAPGARAPAHRASPCRPSVRAGGTAPSGADYFASTARLSDGVGAWAMLAARLGDSAANRAFAERWWHGAVRGTEVLFPAGESMAAALRRLQGQGGRLAGRRRLVQVRACQGRNPCHRTDAGGPGTHVPVRTRAGLRGGVLRGRGGAGPAGGADGARARGP